ncbi:MAG: UDP-N-acetylmuramate--L-alanine ligase [Clostridia bacterium]|nr:UDP-N-acetylmuramate--L-alanine ligase [Clostridiales bacterium]
MVIDLSKDTKLHIHFIGIGGISMSGIAHILLEQGHSISGSDRNASPITEKLKAKGAEVYVGHSREYVKDPDLVVYTSAVDQSNPELQAAREKGIETIDRASMLGLLMKEYRYNVAVAGAHGKTTATSMVSLIMENAGLDPTLLIGGELDKIGGNVKVGSSPYLVTEACEYRENFLKFLPYIAVILNVDQDHLDYFRDFAHIKTAFERFANLVPDHGWVVAYQGDSALMDIVKGLSCNVITYGLDGDAQVAATNMTFDTNGRSAFDLYIERDFIDRIWLALPGEHNVLNALAAISVSRILKIDIDTVKATLGTFTGTHRRFEIKGRLKGSMVVDDYAHHPAEIRATLAAAQNFPHNQIWCVFQPHTYTRTKFLLYEFADSFKGADRIIITDIYAAREKDTGEIHSTHLVEAIKANDQNAIYIPGFEDVVRHLSENLQAGDLVLTVGAGDVYKIGEMLLEAPKKAAH